MYEICHQAVIAHRATECHSFVAQNLKTAFISVRKKWHSIYSWWPKKWVSPTTWPPRSSTSHTAVMFNVIFLQYLIFLWLSLQKWRWQCMSTDKWKSPCCFCWRYTHALAAVILWRWSETAWARGWKILIKIWLFSRDKGEITIYVYVVLVFPVKVFPILH